MPDFTIIIPARNASATVGRCLESVRKQTHPDWEALVIDDGSTDNTAAEITRISCIDARIRLIRNHRKGVSNARNTGLNEATGTYIAFVDADDFVKPNFLSSYLAVFHTDTEIDAVKCGYEILTPDLKTRETVSSGFFQTFTHMWHLIEVLEHYKYYGFVWNTAFRRTTIQNLRFDESVNWLEDQIFSFNAWNTCRKVAVIPNHGYCYIRNREGTNLSNVQDPEVVYTAMHLHHDYASRHNPGSRDKLSAQFDLFYAHSVHKLVELIYTRPDSYDYRQAFSKRPLKSISLIYTPERIFFSKAIPFFIKDKILRWYFRR